MKRQAFASLLLIFVFVLSGLAKEWCGIVPLHSTRADVERVVKVKPLRCRGNSCLYDLADKTVVALYAAEPTCLETSGDTVRSITYYRAAKDDHLRCPVKL